MVEKLHYLFRKRNISPFNWTYLLFYASPCLNSQPQDLPSTNAFYSTLPPLTGQNYNIDQTWTGVPVAWLTNRYHVRLSMSPSFCADCWLCTTWSTVLVPSTRSLNSVHIAYLPWIKERISFHIFLVKISKIKSVLEPTGPSNRTLSLFP